MRPPAEEALNPTRRMSRFKSAARPESSLIAATASNAHLVTSSWAPTWVFPPGFSPAACQGSPPPSAAGPQAPQRAPRPPAPGPRTPPQSGSRGPGSARRWRGPAPANGLRSRAPDAGSDGTDRHPLGSAHAWAGGGPHHQLLLCRLASRGGVHVARVDVAVPDRGHRKAAAQSVRCPSGVGVRSVGAGRGGGGLGRGATDGLTDGPAD